MLVNTTATLSNQGAIPAASVHAVSSPGATMHAGNQIMAATAINGLNGKEYAQKDTTFTKIFVGGLPYHTSDKSLREHFEVYGEIEEAVVITDRQTGKSRGYGFVTMADRSSADRAIKDPNPVIDGRKANVNLAYLGAKPRGPPPATAVIPYPSSAAAAAAAASGMRLLAAHPSLSAGAYGAYAGLSPATMPSQYFIAGLPYANPGAASTFAYPQLMNPMTAAAQSYAAAEYNPSTPYPATPAHYAAAAAAAAATPMDFLQAGHISQPSAVYSSVSLPHNAAGGLPTIATYPHGATQPAMQEARIQ